MPDATHKSKPLHDLNNQLAVIIGFCEVLLDGMDATDTRRDDILEIMQAAHEAKKIAGDAWGAGPQEPPPKQRA